MASSSFRFTPSTMSGSARPRKHLSANFAPWTKNVTWRHPGPALRLRKRAQRQLCAGGQVFAGGDCDHGFFAFPQLESHDPGLDSGWHRHVMAGGLDGMGGRAYQSGQYHLLTLPLVIGIGVTNGIQILNRYAEEGTPGILSRSTGKAVLVSGLTARSRRIRQPDPCAASRHSQFGDHHVRRHRHVYDCGADFFAGAAKFDRSLASDN